MGHVSWGLRGLQAALANRSHHVPFLTFVFAVCLSPFSFPISTSISPLHKKYTSCRAEMGRRVHLAPMAEAPRMLLQFLSTKRRTPSCSVTVIQNTKEA